MRSVDIICLLIYEHNELHIKDANIMTETSDNVLTTEE